MTKLIVDGKEIDVPPAYTLLQACEAGGAEIRASASMNASRSRAIAGCAWSS